MEHARTRRLDTLVGAPAARPRAEAVRPSLRLINGHDEASLFGDAPGPAPGATAERRATPGAPGAGTTAPPLASGGDDDDDLFADTGEWQPLSRSIAKKEAAPADARRAAKSTAPARPVYSFLENEDEAFAELFPSYYSAESVDVKALRAAADADTRHVYKTQDEDGMDKKKMERDFSMISKRLQLEGPQDERGAKRARILGKR
jgi:hypothetical protein